MPISVGNGAERTTRDERVLSTGGNAPSTTNRYDRGDIIAKAEQSDNPNGLKYAAAVELAKQALSDKDDVDDKLFKDTIDQQFQALSPDGGLTGRDMRGENLWTDLVGGAKDAIEGFNTAVGNGMDAVFDNTLGNLGNLGKSEGDADYDWAKKLFNGQDLSIVPDIAEDILLTAVPYVGPALAMGKNAIQQSDNIAEGLSGYDSITGEKIDGGQQAAKIGEAALSTALSGAGGIGKANRALKAQKLGKDLAEETGVTASKLDKAAQRAAEAMPENASIRDKALQTLQDAVGEGGEQALRDANPSFRDVLAQATQVPDNIAGAAKSYKEGFANAKSYNRSLRDLQASDKAKETAKEYQAAVNDSGKRQVKKDQPELVADNDLMNPTGFRGGLANIARMARPYMQAARGQGVIGDVSDAAMRNVPAIEQALPQTIGQRQGERIARQELFSGKEPSKLAKAAGSTAAGYAGGLGNAVLSQMAETGGGPLDAMETMLDPDNGALMSNPTGSVLPFILPLGAKQLSKINPKMSGANHSYRPESTGFNAARAAAAGNDVGLDNEADVGAYLTDPELARRLDYLVGRKKEAE